MFVLERFGSYFEDWREEFLSCGCCYKHALSFSNRRWCSVASGTNVSGRFP
jgi:hypothetical protein